MEFGKLVSILPWVLKSKRQRTSSHPQNTTHTHIAGDLNYRNNDWACHRRIFKREDDLRSYPIWRIYADHKRIPHDGVKVLNLVLYGKIQMKWYQDIGLNRKWPCRSSSNHSLPQNSEVQRAFTECGTEPERQNSSEFWEVKYLVDKGTQHLSVVKPWSLFLYHLWNDTDTFWTFTSMDKRKEPLWLTPDV